MSMPIELYGLCFSNCGAVTSTQTALPLQPDQMVRLCQALGGNSFSFIITQGTKREIVIVSCSGDTPSMLRAQEGTDAQTFTKGATLRFDWTPANLRYALMCAQEDAGDGITVCGIESETLTITRDEEDPCKVSIELASEDAVPVSWRTCNTKYTFESGIISSDPISSALMLTPGIYKNPDITVGADGCITAIQTGSAVVHKSCDPCCNNNCTDEG